MDERVIYVLSFEKGFKRKERKREEKRGS